MNRHIENLKNSPSILVGLVILLVCLGFGFFRLNQLAELSALEADLNKELDTINLNVKNSENIEQDIQTLENQVGFIDKLLFISEERSTNMDFLYSFEEKMNIVISEVNQLDGINPRFSKDGPDGLELYSVVDYNIIVNGTFHEILRFLYEIHQNDIIMRVAGFEVYDSNDDSGKLQADVNVTVLAK